MYGSVHCTMSYTYYCMVLYITHLGYDVLKCTDLLISSLRYNNNVRKAVSKPFAVECTDDAGHLSSARRHVQLEDEYVTWPGIRDWWMVRVMNEALNISDQSGRKELIRKFREIQTEDLCNVFCWSIWRNSVLIKRVFIFFIIVVVIIIIVVVVDIILTMFADIILHYHLSCRLVSRYHSYNHTFSCRFLIS